MDSLERLAEYFHRFALLEVKASSPLYRRLASAIAGDALEVLPGVLAGVSREETPVVFHSHALNQFSPEARRRFEELLSRLSYGRTLYGLSLEGIARDASIQSQMNLTVFSDGHASRQRPLAYYEPHGEWIEWLAEST